MIQNIDQLYSVLLKGRKGWDIEWNDYAKHLSKIIKRGSWFAFHKEFNQSTEAPSYWYHNEEAPLQLKMEARIRLEEYMELIERVYGI